MAAPLPGDMTHIPLAGGTLLVQSGPWLASDPTVDVDTAWGGSNGRFGTGNTAVNLPTGHCVSLMAEHYDGYALSRPITLVVCR